METWKQKVARYKKRQAPYRRKLARRGISKRVRRLESNVEFLYKDVTQAVTTNTVAGGVLLLNGIATGDQHNQRSGEQINMTSIQFKFLALASGSANVIRFMIVLDKQPNGLAFAIADLLEDNTNALKIQSPYNLVNKFRFRVICDKQITIDTNGNSFHPVSAYYKLNVKERFSAATNDIAAINTNSMYAVTIGNSANGDYTFTTRLRYTDS